MKPCHVLALLLLGFAGLTGCSQSLVEKGSPEGGDPEAPASFIRPGIPVSGNAPSLPEKWWTAFRDPSLDLLVESVASHNPDARAALARVDQAYATLGVTSATRFPEIDGSASASTVRDSLNLILFPLDDPQYENYRLAASASWEIDLWGRVRGAVQRDRLSAEASQAEYEAALLSLRSTMARQYFAWRYANEELAILQETLSVRQEALDLQQSRVAQGAGIELDVARSRTELESARSDAQGLERTRGKLEHALAVLAGVAPSEFATPERAAPVRLPRIPPGVPSELLARRPDLRNAERTLRAASLEVGIRKTDYLPRFTLTGGGGVASLSTTNLFTDTDSLFFNLGPQVDFPIFRAGALGGRVDRAQAQWEEAAASYRSALLTAVREVDDTLLDLSVLQRQLQSQAEAVAAAEEAARLTRVRYDRGLVSYFEVVEADRTRLQSRRTENAFRAEQATATVQLIQALGGRW